MAYISIQDFKFGMDRRRERVAGTPGTLWTLENAHLTRGADIERAKKFVPAITLPAGTESLYALNKRLYVFGSDDLADSMPLGITYQRLESPSAGAMVAVVDVLGFSGKVYVIADYDDGGRFHFYDGARVTDWDTIAAAGASYDTLAAFLAEKLSASSAVTAEANAEVISITANVPGVPFIILATTVNGGSTNDQTATVDTPQPNVVGVSETVASATVSIDAGPSGSITEVLVGALSLISAPVAWNGTNEATAIRLAAQITSRTTTTGYSASVDGAVVTISAAVGTGATPNGTPINVTTTGAIAVSADATLSGGVTTVTAVAQVSTVTFGGTFEANDVFTLTLDGDDYIATPLASATGRSLYVTKKRVWSPVGSLWRYCSLADATIWDPADTTDEHDAGFLNVALDVEGNQNLIAAARYQTFDAIYSETSVVLYSLDTDPANFAVSTVLDNTSTTAPNSIIRYGNNDVFHLDPTGVRSLRALNASNAPFVSDVGNAIDTFIADFLATLTEKERRAAQAAIEPKDGRFMLAIADRIFVLSFFPGAKISAWSYYSPGFVVDKWAKIGQRLYARSGDTIYLYGGANGQTYPDNNELPVTVELPYLTANTPATKKGLTAFDAALANEWDCWALPDANRQDKEIHVGKVKNTTFGSGDISLPGQAAIVALKFVCSRAGRATISMAQIHYQKQDEG